MAPVEMFTHLHATLPPLLARQAAEVAGTSAAPAVTAVAPARTAHVDEAEGRSLTMVEAVRSALAQALANDDRVLLLGEDVGADGGVFRATDGLLARFGSERVVDMPLSEALFAGLAVGLGAQGFRPVVEFQFSGFLYPAIDQLVNHASRLRTRTRGRLSCPLVVRAPCGGGIRAPEHHSESTEAMFAHIPGLRVVIPSSPARAYELLLAAIADPDPVIFLEPTRLYRSSHEMVLDDGHAGVLDQCAILRPGTDLTLVSWGASVVDSMTAAEALAEDGVDAEVIDVQTLKPLDMPTILASVERTGRCLIVHEAARSNGVGAEIAAGLADEGLMSLLAPVGRVTGYDTVMPLFRLESHYLPSVERILSGARRVLAYS
jgi:pyruvate dehydrogenase E1 component beta subunit